MDYKAIVLSGIIRYCLILSDIFKIYELSWVVAMEIMACSMEIATII